MIEILTQNEVMENLDFYIDEIRMGKIFIYPTDTLYGLGCDAKNSESVKKIFEIKKRQGKSLLVCAPDIEWIEQNLKLLDNHKEFVKGLLPGHFSFILDLKNKECVSKELLVENQSLGVRIPNSWFQKLVELSQTPFITTSVNFSGQESATNIDEIPEEIKSQVDYIVLDDGSMTKQQSTIYDLREETRKLIRR